MKNPAIKIQNAKYLRAVV